jgi:lipopolysaccharide export LptBFGC system permease protein LptF
VGVFASIFVLLVLVDYIEMVRKTSGLVSASAIIVAETSLFRVPQLLEKLMPFCVLIGAMTCYLALSRRLELVVARAAGVSAWQFIAPALASAIMLGIAATFPSGWRRNCSAPRPAAASRTPPASGSTRSTMMASGSSTRPAANSRACG